MAKKVRFGERLEKGVPQRRIFGVAESGKSGDGKERAVTRMKSLSVNTGVILFIVGLSIFVCAEVGGADWKYYCGNDYYMDFYDAQGITRPSKDVVRVWVKSDYSEKGVLDRVKDFGKKYEYLNHAIVLWEINCAEKKLRRLSTTNYDHIGNVITSSSSQGEWAFIIPESISESLYKTVCK